MMGMFSENTNSENCSFVLNELVSALVSLVIESHFLQDQSGVVKKGRLQSSCWVCLAAEKPQQQTLS